MVGVGERRLGLRLRLGVLVSLGLPLLQQSELPSVRRLGDGVGEGLGVGVGGVVQERGLGLVLQTLLRG